MKQHYYRRSGKPAGTFNSNVHNNQTHIKNHPVVKRRSGKKIDPRLFVNKAMAQVAVNPIQSEHLSFESLPIVDHIKLNIKKKGYTKPTPIQEQTIPPILEGRDVIGIANTGTGKTAAFLIPMLDRMLKKMVRNALVLVPTRELAIQIFDEYRSLSNQLPVQAVLCIGGTSMYNQEQQLSRNPHIIIGTPGRIKDLVNRNKIAMTNIQIVVLDEVDHMLDIGFLPDMKYLISRLPATRQSLFFTATLPESVRDVMNSFVKNAVEIQVKTRDTATHVEQDIIHVKDQTKKVDILYDLLVQPELYKVIVFGRTKWGIEKLTRTLVHRGITAASTHGNKTQNQRRRALDQFKQDQVQVLLATDIAARGIDIPDVTHVINYDQPATYEDYIHRIGRTGRAEKQGKALTFVE